MQESINASATTIENLIENEKCALKAILQSENGRAVTSKIFNNKKVWLQGGVQEDEANLYLRLQAFKAELITFIDFSLSENRYSYYGEYACIKNGIGVDGTFDRYKSFKFSLDNRLRQILEELPTYWTYWQHNSPYRYYGYKEMRYVDVKHAGKNELCDNRIRNQFRDGLNFANGLIMDIALCLVKILSFRFRHSDCVGRRIEDVLPREDDQLAICLINCLVEIRGLQILFEPASANLFAEYPKLKTALLVFSIQWLKRHIDGNNDVRLSISCMATYLSSDDYIVSNYAIDALLDIDNINALLVLSHHCITNSTVNKRVLDAIRQKTNQPNCTDELIDVFNVNSSHSFKNDICNAAAYAMCFSPNKTVVRTLLRHLLNSRTKRDIDAFAFYNDDNSVFAAFCSIRPFEMLLSEFNSSNAEEISLFAVAFSRIGDFRATECILLCLNFDNENIVKEVVKALGKIGDTNATEALLNHLARNDNEDIVEEIVKALGKIGDERATEAITEILAGLFKNKYGYSSLVEESIKALGRLKNSSAIDSLVEFLKNPLELFGHDATSSAIVDALCEIGDIRVLEDIIKLQPSFSVIRALSHFGGERAKEYLSSIFAIDERWHSMYQHGFDFKIWCDATISLLEMRAVDVFID